MSQRRPKKQLSIIENVQSLTDQELREALKTYNESPGPITDSTRNIYRKKLASLIEQADKGTASNFLELADDDDDDTSDEDYNAQEDEETEDDEDYESDENEDQDENEDVELVKTSPSFRPSRIILMPLVCFFGLLFFTQTYKSIAKEIVIFLFLSPILYAGYRAISTYRHLRHKDSQDVCNLVEEALELLKSPECGGSMPILHIRDTLLTPAERKAKKNLWTKAVKFIEEHESRVRVELLNLDGEDFRAWKWIGSRK